MNDATLLSEIAFRSKAHWGYSAQFIEGCRKELSVTPEKICSPNYLYMIYELEDQAIGFYALEKLTEDCVELEALFVEPNYIGKGFGNALITHAIEYAKITNYQWLTIQSDPHTETFYKKFRAILVTFKESNSITGRYLPALEIDLAKT